MNALLRFSHVVDGLSEGFGRLANGLVTVLVFVGFANVLLRFIGRAIGRQLTSNTVIEVQWYLFSLLFLVGFAYVLRHNVNVRVDFLYVRWGSRRRAWVNLLGTLFFLIPFCLLAIYVSVNPVLASWGRLPNGGWGNWELSPDPGGLPRAPIKSMIIVGFTLLLLQALSQAIKYAAILTGHVAEGDAVGAIAYQQPSFE